MRFEVTFHTPFRVATGRAGPGVDSAIDRDVLLPASSLKGIMLSAARDLLAVDSARVQAVFGTVHRPSPWGWSDATLASVVRPRARVQINPDTGVVTTGALALAEEVLATTAEFTVDQIGWIEATDQLEQEQLLAASAAAVTSLGGDRRRGLGWVSLRPVDPVWTPAELADAVIAARHHGSRP